MPRSAVLLCTTTVLLFQRRHFGPFAAMGPKKKTRGKSSKDIQTCISTFSCITGTKLPSRLQVLGRLRYRMEEMKESLREASRAVIQEIRPFWVEKGGVPMQDEKHCIVKLEQLHDFHRTLKKSSYRDSESQRNKEKEFIGSLHDLFDVAHAEAMSLIPLEEDRKFLEWQRQKNRPGNFLCHDAKLASQKKRTENRQKRIEFLRQKATLDAQTAFKAVDSDSAAIPRSDSPDSVSSPECEREQSPGPSFAVHGQLHPPVCPEPETCASALEARRPARPKNIMTPLLAATLDRVKLTDRNAVYVLTAFAKSLGHDTSELAISRTTIRTARVQYRKEIASRLRIDPDLPGVYTVHWDGKLLPALTGRETVDRLPVLVSVGDEVSLLAVPQLSTGTGEAQATAVYEALENHGLEMCIAAMCFDTTRSNTGLGKGACLLLEKKLGKLLLWLPCRHHIMELLLRAAWDNQFGTSSAPTVPCFERFRSAWFESEGLKHIPYDKTMVDSDLIVAMGDDKDRVVDFIRHQLATKQPRDDYLELLELALLNLGEGSDSSAFRTPGSDSHARWMSKAIYTLKMWLFRGFFKLSKTEKQRFPVLCVFILKVYIEAWFQCTNPVAAPRLDLLLIQKLHC